MSTRLRRASTLLCTLALALALSRVAAAANLYSNDFQGSVGPEWNYPTIESTPLPLDGSRRFLGRFDNQTVTLTLTDTHPHTQFGITFDFYANGTWDGIDGSGLGYGPDSWEVSVAGGPVLLHTTFSNVTDPPFGIPFLQNYPDAAGGPTHPQFTGSVEQRTLGYIFSGYDVSAVYHMSYTVPDTATTIVFQFSGSMGTGYSGPHDITEESWGLDNVVVTDDAVVGVPVPGAAPGFALDAVRPNPATGSRLSVQFELPDTRAAQLELLDVAGRRVAARDVGALGAGSHRVSLGDGARVPPGVYLVRLSAGDRSAVQRVAVVE